MLVAFVIILVHFVADFICQDEKWANNKSKCLVALVKHTVIYMGVWILFGVWICFPSFNPTEIIKWMVLFPGVTFIFHTVTDYFTSKVTSSLYMKKKFGDTVPNFGFFTMIGFDQVLHYAQLFLTYYYINKI